MSSSLRWFPEMREGESLYSILSHYAEEMEISYWHHVSRALLGRVSSQPSTLFFYGIGFLSSLLPHNHCHNPERIIHEHTGVPLLQISLNAEDYSSTISQMIHGSSGRQTGHHQYEERDNYEQYRIKYCPLCIEKASDSSFPQIHTVHQFKYVEFCPTHKCKLVFVTESHSLANFSEIKPTGDCCFGHVYYPSSPSELLQSKLSQFHADCLRNAGFNPDRKTTIQKILGKLAHSNTWIQKKPEIERFADSLSDAYGYELFIQKRKKSVNLRNAKYHSIIADSSYSLLLHIIAMIFSTYTEFLQFQPLPWGEGPYPCINTERVHHKINTIRRYRLYDKEKEMYIFRCELCHHAYIISENDFREDGFKKSASIGIVHRRPKRAFKSPEVLLSRKEECISEITQMITSIGDCSSSLIIKALPSQCSFLMTYFPDSLKEIIPKPLRNKKAGVGKRKQTTFVSEERDERMLQQAKDCYMKHCSQTIPPRISIFMFQKRLGKRHYMSTIQKMPRTFAFIQSVLETNDEYKRRAALQSINHLKEQAYSITVENVYHTMKKRQREKALDEFIINAIHSLATSDEE